MLGESWNRGAGTAASKRGRTDAIVPAGVEFLRSDATRHAEKDRQVRSIRLMFMEYYEYDEEIYMPLLLRELLFFLPNFELCNVDS